MNNTMNSRLVEVAKEILANTPGKEMHVNEIAEKAMALNKNLGLPVEELTKKLSSALSANLKSKTPCFLKPKNKQGKERRGYYKVRRTAIAPAVQISKIKIPAVSTLFSGKAGEFAVASQLLFWGYNVSFPAVDNGIDIMAEIEGQFKAIQVKTCAKTTASDEFAFKIDAKSFDDVANRHRDVWYVFVMKSGLDIDYAILPNAQLSLWRKLKIIGGSGQLSIQITRDPKRKKYTIGDNDITPYINDFRVIQTPAIN